MFTSVYLFTMWLTSFQVTAAVHSLSRPASGVKGLTPSPELITEHAFSYDDF